MTFLVTSSSILMTSMFDKAGIFVEQSNLAVGHFQVSSLILQLCCFRSLCKYPLRLQRKRSRLVASLKNSLLVSYFLELQILLPLSSLQFTMWARRLKSDNGKKECVEQRYRNLTNVKLILSVLSPLGCQEEGVQCCSCTSRRVCKLNNDQRTCYFIEVSGL